MFVRMLPKIAKITSDITSGPTMENSDLWMVEQI